MRARFLAAVGLGAALLAGVWTVNGIRLGNIRVLESRLRELELRAAQLDAERGALSARVRATETAYREMPEPLRRGFADPESVHASFFDHLAGVAAGRPGMQVTMGRQDAASTPLAHFVQHFRLEWDFVTPRESGEVLAGLLMQDRFPVRATGFRFSRQENVVHAELDAVLYIPARLSFDAGALFAAGTPSRADGRAP